MSFSWWVAFFLGNVVGGIIGQWIGWRICEERSVISLIQTMERRAAYFGRKLLGNSRESTESKSIGDSDGD